MKKFSLLLGFIITGITLFAQGPKFGLKAGLNIAQFSTNSSTDFNSRLGLHAGALAHLHLGPMFALQPEVVYSSQGAKFNVGNDEHSLGLSYINIPVNLQYMFNNGFRIQTGPQVGFLIDVNDKVNGQETGFFNSDDFHNVDLAWSFGLGYLTTSGLGLDARYNLGLRNINEDGGGNSLKNNVFQLGLFYMFDHAHKAKSR
jgi:hypothetical protein